MPQPFVLFDNVCKYYQMGETRIAASDHVSFEIEKGEFCVILGPSGAGKTTLFNLLLGLYEPTSGEIAVDGTPLTAANRRAWQNRIGYVSQRLFLTDGTFAANVAPGVPAAEINRRRVTEALEAAQLGEFIASLPLGDDSPLCLSERCFPELAWDVRISRTADQALHQYRYEQREFLYA